MTDGDLSVQELRKLTEVLVTLVDPRSDDEHLVTTVVAMDHDTAHNALIAVCAWTAGVLETRAQKEGVTVNRLMAQVRDSLFLSVDEYERLDHEGGLFT